jgi:hypothetical protein
VDVLQNVSHSRKQYHVEKFFASEECHQGAAMSYVISAHIWTQSKQKGSCLLLLLALGDFADENGWAYPSVATLAERLRMTDRNVRKLIDQVEAGGELVVYNQREREDSERHFSNVYFIPTSHSNESMMPEKVKGYTRRRGVTDDTTVVSQRTLPTVTDDTTVVSQRTLPTVTDDTTVVSQRTADPLKDPSKDPSRESLNNQKTRARESPNETDFTHWEMAHQQLKLQLDAANFEPNLRGAKLLAVERPIPPPPSPERPEVWVIGVRSPLAADHCAGRLHRTIGRILSDATGLPTECIRMCFEAPELIGVVPLPAAVQTSARAELVQPTSFGRHLNGSGASDNRYQNERKAGR